MRGAGITAVVLALWLPTIATAFENEAVAGEADRRVKALRAAVEDLMATFGERYPDGARFLKRLETVEKADFEALRREVLLANPLISEQPILYVVRHPDVSGTHEYLGSRTFRGRGSALKLLDVKTGKTRSLFENQTGPTIRPRAAATVGAAEAHSARGHEKNPQAGGIG